MTTIAHQYALPRFEVRTKEDVIDKVVQANKSVAAHNQKVKAFEAVAYLGCISAIAFAILFSPAVGVVTFIGTLALGAGLYNFSKKDVDDINNFHFIFALARSGGDRITLAHNEALYVAGGEPNNRYYEKFRINYTS